MARWDSVGSEGCRCRKGRRRRWSESRDIFSQLGLAFFATLPDPVTSAEARLFSSGQKFIRDSFEALVPFPPRNELGSHFLLPLLLSIFYSISFPFLFSR